MNEHLRQSEKVASLERENASLAASKGRLEGELENARRIAAPFAMNSGEELQVRLGGAWAQAARGTFKRDMQLIGARSERIVADAHVGLHSHRLKSWSLSRL